MQPVIFKLWESDIPGYTEGGEIPTLAYYPAEKKLGDGCVVICPGGGYRLRSAHEGHSYAMFLNSIGLDAFVLEYRVSPVEFPYPLLDARRAMRIARANAKRFGYSKDRIAIMGSSAGGHLAALCSTYCGRIDGEGADGLDEVDYRPNAQILCYPVIERTGHLSSFQHLLGDRLEELCESVTPSLIADSDTPPAFIWHTATDASVNVINTYNYAKKLREIGISTEMHIFPLGAHGLGLADGIRGEWQDIPYVSRWASMLAEWLRLMGFLNS